MGLQLIKQNCLVEENGRRIVVRVLVFNEQSFTELVINLYIWKDIGVLVIVGNEIEVGIQRVVDVQGIIVKWWHGWKWTLISEKNSHPKLHT